MHGRASEHQNAENFAPFRSVDQYGLLIQWSLQIHARSPAPLHECLYLTLLMLFKMDVRSKDDKYRLIGQEGYRILFLANN